MKDLERHLNALQVVIIALVLIGAFSIQLFLHEQPCPLCFLQRLGMLGVGSGALMNLRFGPHKRYYGLSLLAAFFGGFVALRQMALHACPGTKPFGVPFWGLSLYTWSFLIFACSVLFISIMLIFFKEGRNEKKGLHLLHKAAFLLLFSAAFGNIIDTAILCGMSACVSP